MSFSLTPIQLAKERAEWSPYTLNGGTVVAVAGDDYCIVAGDSRITRGYSIDTRNGQRVTALTEQCVMATAGMYADQEALSKLLDYRLRLYEHQHGKGMTTSAVSQLLSVTLYTRRFFPLYTFNVLGGLDENGRGVVFSYDAIGSTERVAYSATGGGQTLIQPLLDNQLGWKNAKVPKPKLSCDECLDLIKDAFASAGERDINTGDNVDIVIMQKGMSPSHEVFQLKKD